jgi:hypothetical protein
VQRAFAHASIVGLSQFQLPLCVAHVPVDGNACHTFGEGDKDQDDDSADGGTGLGRLGKITGSDQRLLIRLGQMLEPESNFSTSFGLLSVMSRMAGLGIILAASALHPRPARTRLTEG